MLSNLFDIIVVGGGLAGSVITSRLHQNNSALNILLIEAGPDVSNNTIIPYASNQGLLINSPWDWNDTTTPQTGLNGRSIPNPAGRGLGGGTIINSCGWIRGDSHDFDEWGSIVNDQRWSYNGQLPYFRKSEHTWNTTADPVQHGFVGPMWSASVSFTGRNYPLRDNVSTAWSQLGVQRNWDANGGSPQGVGELNENRKNGLRELASSAYPLDGVHVMTNTVVAKVLLSKIGDIVLATGVELANGTRLYALREVILSAGAYRTPQLLMLSGIGPKAELAANGITQLVDSPSVGLNLTDHLLWSQFWKLTDAAQAAGVAIGSSNPLFSQPQFGLGTPADWVTTQTVPLDGLKAAITADEGKAPSDSHPLLQNRSFMEALVIYVGANAADPVIQYNGSHIISTLVGLMPSSRGTVTLNSSSINDPPVINPNYFTTQVDQFVFRYGVQRMAQLMLGTAAMSNIIASETPPDSFAPISLNSTDDYLNARIRYSAGNTYHPHGTCAMGKVVDTDLKVNGVYHLRVADASVFPTAIAAHLQQAVYAMAEQAAMIFAADLETEW
ncbi:GMC oxidoreductase [Lepidopterella palustris CBS 459.81]|uniref:GMC oxidoreductase n=1 Tax=Lepidopterella palustris CBS 459.81 TaxID=1314670 RepID=A0A8E2EJY7_9PEZI|nr:GMC oxidoreductase [Lepidopterella palustris CBS 459.81]